MPMVPVSRVKSPVTLSDVTVVALDPDPLLSTCAEVPWRSRGDEDTENEPAELSRSRSVFRRHQRAERSAGGPQSVAQPRLHRRGAVDHGLLRGDRWRRVARSVVE